MHCFHFVIPAALVISLAQLSHGQASESDLVLFIDKTENLALELNANERDTLDVDLADVDNDGDLDVFAVDGSGSTEAFPNRLLINDGTGTFSDESATRLPQGAPQNSTEVDFADIDSDGDLDALVSNLGPNQLLLNDGTGHFSDASTRLPQATPPGPPGFAVPFFPFFIEVSAEAIFVDVDGDNDEDILIANENPFPTIGPPGDVNRLLLNDGAGNFTEAWGRIPSDISQGQGFATGDIDGDGDLDLVQIDVGSNRVLVNDGSGSFLDETSNRMPANSASSRKGILVDVDGDGSLDLVVANSRNQQNRIFINDGTGVFLDETSSRLPARLDTSTDVDAVDLDADGDLDLYVTNVGDFVTEHGFLGDTNTVLLNDGVGHFVDGTFPRASERAGRSTNAEFGDVDGDGVPDLLVANSGGVDQPGLPPPDGQDRLYRLVRCKKAPELCMNGLLGDLREDIAELSPEPFPEGDMSSSVVALNRFYKTVLSLWIERAETFLARGFLSQAGRRARWVAQRSDGLPFPRDWVDGEAGERIFIRADFAARLSN